MINDGRRVPDQSRLQADLCIVGGGPAGISLALRVAGRRGRVVILESGGLEEDRSIQDLGSGEIVGLPYFPLDETHFRVLGGSSNRWGGWCRPIDAHVFEHRPWVPDSGWPISRADLDPYYQEAALLCQLEDPSFEPRHWIEHLPDLYRPPFVGGDVAASVWQGSPPTKFGAVYRENLQTAPDLNVYLNATAVRIDTEDNGRTVSGVEVATLEGNKFQVVARRVVLCAGALETPRLMLASGGLGNQNDNVGRYFMEHPHLVTGRLRLSPREPGRRPFIPAVDLGLKGAYDRINLQRPSGAIKAAFMPTPGTQKRDQLMAFATRLTTGSTERREDSDAYNSLKLVVGNLRSLGRVATQVRHRTLPAGLSRQLANIVRHPIEVVSVTYDEIIRRPEYLEFYSQAEQAPNRDSRVTLSEETDALGMRRLRLDWRLTEFDKDSIRRAQEVVANRLEDIGLGRLEPEPWLLNDEGGWGPTLRGGHHHLGTARMSDNPVSGVVDRHGRVHGIDNLYVADSSVFPSGGFSNPLLTVVALALRCGDHLLTLP